MYESIGKAKNIINHIITHITMTIHHINPLNTNPPINIHHLILILIPNLHHPLNTPQDPVNKTTH
jgi:hypothetical protein